MNVEGLKEYKAKRGHAGVDIGKSSDLLRRFSFIEQSCVRALAGWFLKYADWEVKIKLGYFLYTHAEHVNRFGLRLEEMRGGNRHANMEPALDLVGEELVHAPDEQSFLHGFYLILSAVEEAYQDFIAAADPAANAPDIRILKQFVYEIRQEKEELKEFSRQPFAAQRSWSNSEHQPAPEPKAGNEWAEYMQSLLQAAGGISGMKKRENAASKRPEGARLAWPAPIQFDNRLQHAELGTYESKVSLPLRERCIGEFEVYFNEFYAAALLATVIYDSWKMTAPVEYFMDIAHHFWDEVRHAEFGAIRLRELGVEPHKINMQLFEQSQNMPLLHRFCYLTLGLEIFFMPRKSERARFYEQQNDTRSQLFADVDWSEEINHVRYGKRWLDYFLKDDARTVEEIQEEIAKYLEEFQKTMPEGRKAPW